MKKLLYLGAVAAMLLGTASCSSDMEPQLADGTVQFKVELPGGFESRAISDGTTATKLDVACYDADGNKLPVEPTVKTDFVNRVATVTYKLVKGQTYNFAFFAHAKYKSASYPQFDYYKFEPGEKFEDCKFVYNGRHETSDFANNEERDAFYGTLTNYEVTSAETTVKLTRPFAQLNLGIDDLEAAQAAGIEPRNVRITIRKASKAFNIASGTASVAPEDAVESLFYYYENKDEAGAMPYKKGETLTVDGKDYTWISMNYLLVPENEANLDVEVKIHTTKTSDGTDGKDFEFTVPGVPFKKNHRTNILGSLLTEEGNFKVIIDQNFDTPDYNVDANAVYYDVNESSNFESILNAINTDQPEKAIVRIAEGATLTLTNPNQYFTMIDETNTGTKEVIFEGAGKDKSFFKEDGGGVDGVKVTNGAKITFRNLTIIDDTRYNAEDGNNAWEFAYLEFYGNFKFENVKFADGIQPEGNDSEFEFVGCDFISDGNPKRDSDKQGQEYAMWACGGKFTFTNCTVTGYRGLKFHEKYGSDITFVYIDNCVFHDITLKPGIAIGEFNATTIFSIKNSQFINCQPGDQGLYKYETDTPVANFQFTDENNTVQNN